MQKYLRGWMSRKPERKRVKNAGLTDQYPMNIRIMKNTINPISALTGIVRIHAIMMLLATPHFTVLAPMVVPTPMIDVQMI